MADNHHAVFEAVPGDLEAIQETLLPALARHGVAFSGSVRGLAWSAEYNEFEPVAEQEAERIGSIFDALEMASSWTCIALDCRLFQWDIEVYIFRDPKRVGSLGIGHSLPHSAFKALAGDASMFRRWRAFLLDVAASCGRVAMICGTDVPLEGLIPSEVEKMVAIYVRDGFRRDTGVHSALLPSASMHEPLTSSLRRAGFATLEDVAAAQFVSKVGVDSPGR